MSTERSSSPASGAANQILAIEELTRTFGSLVAVDRVDLSIETGELHSIIGPNGAGKTTLFNMIAGSLPPTDGRVYFRGTDITDRRMDERCRMGVSRAYQITQLFLELSVIENLRLAAQATGQSFNPLAEPDPAHREAAIDMFEQLEINARQSTRADTLSHGDKKKLGIGMALLTDPELLLLDEPTSGLSQDDSGQVIEFLSTVTEDLTVLLIEHDVDLVLSVSDRVTVLHQGRVIAQGSPEAISEDEQVQEAYLGGY